MPETRLHIPAPMRTGIPLRLDPGQAHYLGRVLRMQKGSKLAIFDGRGNEHIAVVTELTKTGAVLDVGEKLERSAESPLSIRLVQGVARGERMDFAVQKATELGVASIQPVLTKHAVVKLNSGRAERRREHWQRVAASACEQCGRNVVPAVASPVSLPDFLDQNSDAALRLTLAPDAARGIGSVGGPVAGPVELLVGPEGGLSDDEIHASEEAGFTACNLGPRILRSETAGVAALAALQTLWGDLDVTR